MVKKQKWWQRASRLLILILALCAYGYIFKRLFSFIYWDSLIDSFSFSGSSIILIFVLLLLWAGNLYCEAKKWQSLFFPFKKINFLDSIKQVLAGTVTAVGSPSRIAEMGGRMALLPKDYRVNAALMTSIGGFLQNVIILLVGIAVLLLPHSPQQLLLQQLNLQMFQYVALLTFVLVIILFLIFKVWRKQVRIVLLTLKKISNKVIVESLIWTFCRYIIYTLQLYCWILFFDIPLSFELFLIYSPVYFLLITIVPSHILVDMGIRGSIALLLFGAIIENEPLIIAGIFAQWFSNVVLPTLLGSVILLRYKVIKQEVMQKER